MKVVLRKLVILLPSLVLVMSVQGQGLTRVSHKVTISRAPETAVSLPGQADIVRLDVLKPDDVVRIQSNESRLKLVLSVVEPVEESSARRFSATTSLHFREVFSSETNIDPADAVRVPITELTDSIPDEVSRKEIQGRRLVVTVTQ